MSKENNKSLEKSTIQALCIVIMGLVTMVTMVVIDFQLRQTKQKAANEQIASLEAQLANTFIVKGAGTTVIEIDDEEHYFVCYHVTVSEFAFADDERAKDRVGAEEEFIPFMYPDGAIVYHSTYYEALSEYRGRKVVKEFMDYGPVDGELLPPLAGVETPLYVVFEPLAGSHSGILENRIAPLSLPSPLQLITTE